MVGITEEFAPDGVIRCEWESGNFTCDIDNDQLGSIVREHTEGVPELKELRRVLYEEVDHVEDELDYLAREHREEWKHA